MRYFVTIDGREHVIDVAQLPGGDLDVQLVDAASGASTPLVVEANLGSGPATVHVAGRVFDLVVDAGTAAVTVFASGRRLVASVESAHQRAAASVRSGGRTQSTGLVTSPMPGKVVKMLVAEGDTVEPGRPLVVVEAMKMENELVAEVAGVVRKVFVQPGDAVEGGARLISIE